MEAPHVPISIITIETEPEAKLLPTPPLPTSGKLTILSAIITVATEATPLLTSPGSMNFIIVCLYV